jgi:hypothetical protein
MSYGRLMLDLAATELSQQESVLLQNPQVGGVILFARNIESPEQGCRLAGPRSERRTLIFCWRWIRRVGACSGCSRALRDCLQCSCWVTSCCETQVAGLALA